MTEEQLRQLQENLRKGKETPRITKPVLNHPEMIKSQSYEQTDLLNNNPRKTSKLESDLGNGALGQTQAQKRAGQKFLVRITAIRKRLIDEDNLCEKYHVDLCRYSGIIPDDSPEQTKIEVSQRKAKKGEEEFVMIEVFLLQDR